MSPILDIQRRGQQIGRLRLGEQVQASNGKMRPSRLTTWRFTTASKVTADAVAALYGGTVRDWERQFEVITTESALGVTVPPRDQVVSQWYEMWSKGGASRRCTSQHEQISNGPCLCPHAKDPGDEDEVARCALERSRLASLNPPKACKLITRISVMIPDLPGLGVWRVDTHSFYAASEIGDSADIMQMARDKGIFLPAILRIEQRSRVANGETKNFPVPVLEITRTFRQIVSGEMEAGGIMAQLPPPPGEQPKAITAGTPDLPGPALGNVSATQQRPGGSEAADRAGEPAMEPWERARVIYEHAMAASDARTFQACVKQAKAEQMEEEQVLVDREQDEWTDLETALRDLWREKAKAGAA